MMEKVHDRLCPIYIGYIQITCLFTLFYTEEIISVHQTGLMVYYHSEACMICCGIVMYHNYFDM